MLTAREVLARWKSETQGYFWDDASEWEREQDQRWADEDLAHLAEHGYAVVSTRPADLETAAEAIAYADREACGLPGGTAWLWPADYSEKYLNLYRSQARAALVALGATVPGQ